MNTIITILSLGVILVILLILSLWSIGSLVALISARGVPFVPLNKKQLQAINKNIKLKAGDKVVDLGCGDGRVLRLFEKQGVQMAEGCEINLWACVLAWLKNWILKSKTKVYYKNFDKVDLAGYDVIFVYLLEGALKRLSKKLDAELKPGTRIISYAFEIKEWRRPQEIIYTKEDDKKSGRIFIYKI